MKKYELNKSYCVRINYPCDYEGLGRVTWYDVTAKSEADAIKKARKLASENIKAEVIQVR